MQNKNIYQDEDILKYAKHHCPDSEDPYEITDRIFIDVMKANSGKDQQ